MATHRALRGRRRRVEHSSSDGRGTAATPVPPMQEPWHRSAYRRRSSAWSSLVTGCARAAGTIDSERREQRRPADLLDELRQRRRAQRRRARRLAGQGSRRIRLQARWLRDLGGNQDFTGDPDAALDGTELRAAASPARHADRPASGGTRHEALSRVLLRQLLQQVHTARRLVRRRELVAAGAAEAALAGGRARLLGFAGIAIDQELYRSRAARARRRGIGTTRATTTARGRCAVRSRSAASRS